MNASAIRLSQKWKVRTCWVRIFVVLHISFHSHFKTVTCEAEMKGTVHDTITLLSHEANLLRPWFTDILTFHTFPFINQSYWCTFFITVLSDPFYRSSIEINLLSRVPHTCAWYSWSTKANVHDKWGTEGSLTCHGTVVGDLYQTKEWYKTRVHEKRTPHFCWR